MKDLSMVRGAISTMLGVATSRVLGLLREMTIAFAFGSSWALDAFWVAYTIPNLLRYLLAEGALSASLVPVLSRLVHRGDRDRALKVAGMALSLALIFSGASALAIALTSPALTRALAPGFGPHSSALAQKLTVFLSPYIVFMSAGAVLMGLLNSAGHFFAPAASSAVSNLLVIALTLVLCVRMGFGIWGLALAVMAGGLSQYLFQHLYAVLKGMPVRPALPRREGELLEAAGRFLPYAAGNSLSQLGVVIDRFLASFLEEGSISTLGYAFRFLQLPLGLFAVGVAQAALPALSVSEGPLFAETLRRAMGLSLFVSIPAAMGLLALSKPLMLAFFYGGAFGERELWGSSSALSLYALGIPATAVYFIATRAFYAAGRTKEPLICTALGLSSNFVLSALLMRGLSFRGIALATSISAFLSAWMALRMLGGKALPGLPWWGKLAASSVPPFLAILLASRAFDPSSRLGAISLVALSSLGFSALFFSLGQRLGLSEARALKEILLGVIKWRRAGS